MGDQKNGGDSRESAAHAHLAERTDEELIALFNKAPGNGHLAFEVLVRRYEATAFRSCLRYLSKKEEAEEACQEVFLRAYRGLTRFRGRSSFKTWLFRILHNQCMSHIAARKRRQILSQALRNTEIGNPSHHPSDETATLLHDHIQQALEKLSASERGIIILRFVSDLSLDEIAGTLRIRLSAAKMRYYRSLEHFEDAYRALDNPTPNSQTGCRGSPPQKHDPSADPQEKTDEVSQ